MFVAQPSEETVTGAKAMLADGLFQKFGKPDYAFALHTGSMPYGTVGYVAGAATSIRTRWTSRFTVAAAMAPCPTKA